jgi:hypothetical protein
VSELVDEIGLAVVISKRRTVVRRVIPFMS